MTNNVERRLIRLEEVIARCSACDPGRVVLVGEGDPEPEPTCPACGRPWRAIVRVVGVDLSLV